MEEIRNLIVIEDKYKIITNKHFINCSFKENNFFRATIEDCIFDDCNFEGSNFSKAIIARCKFINCDFTYNGMGGISIVSSRFTGCDFSHSILSFSKISNTTFINTQLRAIFKDLEWTGNSFDDTTIVESCGGTHCGLCQEDIDYIMEHNRIFDKSRISL